MIRVEGASPEEIAAIAAVLGAATVASPDETAPQQSPWKFANLHPELGIDALRWAQGKRFVL